MKIDYKKTQEAILKIVLEYYNISIYNIKSKTHKRVYAEPRQMYFYLLTKYTKMSYMLMGETINRDHSTVTHSKKTISNLLESDKKIIDDYNNLVDIINNKLFNKVYEKQIYIVKASFGRYDDEYKVNLRSFDDLKNAELYKTKADMLFSKLSKYYDYLLRKKRISELEMLHFDRYVKYEDYNNMIIEPIKYSYKVNY